MGEGREPPLPGPPPKSFYPSTPRRPGETRRGPGDDGFRDAKGQAEVPLPAEAPARHGQDVFLFQAVHEGQVVPARGLGEKVEGPRGSTNR